MLRARCYDARYALTPGVRRGPPTLMSEARRMNRLRHRIVVFWVALLVVVTFAERGEAHTPAPVYLSMDIGEEEILLTGTIGYDLFRDWLGVEPEGCAALTGEDLALAASKVEALFRDWGAVEVDGLLINPVFDSLGEIAYDDLGVAWKYVTAKVKYGTKAAPQQVAFSWRRYENSLNWWIAFVEAEINAPGGGTYLEFTREEPQFVWHAPTRANRGGAFTDPVFEVPEPLSLPLVTLGMFAALLPGVILIRKLGTPRRIAWPVIVLVLAVGTSLNGFARVDVERPWGPGFTMPDEEHGRFIFESLQRNIYRAFDYTSENDIYETLARSVRGELLDQVYGEVYESLILRDQGGAVCKIQGTRIIESEVEFPGERDATWFFVDSTWQVRGKVGHWGHTHARVNEYRARYTVSADGEQWKISAVETLDQRRLPEEEAKATWEEGR